MFSRCTLFAFILSVLFFVTLCSAQNSTLTPAPAKFLYDSSGYSYGTLEFKVNSKTGSLTYVTDGGTQLAPSMASTPNGHFLYGGAPLYAYAVNQSTGHLSQLHGSPYEWSGYLAMTQSGQYLVLADYFDTKLRSLKVNPTTGELTQASQVSIPETALYLTTDSSGQYAYVQLSNSIAAYKLNAQTGKLTAVPGSPFASGPATCCPGSSLSASKKYLYALNDDQTISGFAINPTTGELTKLKNFPLSSSLVQGLVLDPVHNFLITAHSSTNYVTSYLNLFSINPSTGALKKIGRFGVGQVWDPFTLGVDPSAKILYVSDLSQESCAFDSCVGALATFLIDEANNRLSFVQNGVSTGEPYDYRQTLAPVR